MAAKFDPHFTMNRHKSPVKSRQTPAPGVFRIIGGQWRGRKLQFPATKGLRPTPDRVRETLFNWLAIPVRDANCLDLFCGSGALGLEALSRGAARCIFVDSEKQALQAIHTHISTLNAQGTTLHCRLPEGLETLKGRFNLVFIDPPYALAAVSECLHKLVHTHLLGDEAWVYIENSSSQPLPELPEGFSIYRHKTAGQVQYCLLHYQSGCVERAG